MDKVDYTSTIVGAFKLLKQLDKFYNETSGASRRRSWV
jgi:hypothetical protein